MPADLLALSLFAFVAAVTPGPNNVMVMASGAAFGHRRTIPHMLGITVGFAVMLVLVGLGLAGVLEAVPALLLALKLASLAYMLWFAWKILNAPAPEAAPAAGSRPLRFLEGALFQWINPKAWAFALALITIHVPGHALAPLLVAGVLVMAVTLPSLVLWTMLGEALRRWLTSDRRRRAFNAVMAALLVASILPVLRSA